MPSHDNHAFLWIDQLEQSRQALANCSYCFFLDRLRPSFHWRLLPHILKDALYLDIESTGLSRHHHYVTVIGAPYQGRFYQWVWSEPLDELKGHCLTTIVGDQTRRWY